MQWGKTKPVRSANEPIFAQPKEIKDIREFLAKAKRKDVTEVKMKKTMKDSKEIYKFKLRSSRFLYTLQVPNHDKAEKVKASLGKRVKKVE